MGQKRHDASHVNHCDGANDPGNVIGFEGLGVLLRVSRSRRHTVFSGFESGRRGSRRLPRSARIVSVAACLSAIFSLGIGAVSLAQDSEVTHRLFTAVHKNDLAGVQIAVADGADIQVRNRLGLTALDLAVDKGHFEIAHYLISVRDIQSQAESGAEASSQQPSRIESPAPAAPATVGRSGLPQPPATPPAPTAWPQAVPNPFETHAVPPGARHPVVGESPPSGMPALPPGMAADQDTEPSGLQPQAGEFVAPVPRGGGGLKGPAIPPPSRPGVERSSDPLAAPSPPRFERPPPKPEPRGDAAEMPQKKPDSSPSAEISVPSTPFAEKIESAEPAKGSRHTASEAAGSEGGEASVGWRDSAKRFGARLAARAEGVLGGAWLAPESPVRVVIDLPPRIWPVAAAHAEELPTERGDIEHKAPQPSAHEGTRALRSNPGPEPASIETTRHHMPDAEVAVTFRFMTPPRKPALAESKGDETRLSATEAVEGDLETALVEAPSHATALVGRDSNPMPAWTASAEAWNPFMPDAVAPGSRHPEIGETPRVVPPPPSVRMVRVNIGPSSVPSTEPGPNGQFGKAERPAEEPFEGSDFVELVAAPGEQIAQAASDDRAAADAGTDTSNTPDSGPFVPLQVTPGGTGEADDKKVVMVPPVPSNPSEDGLSIGRALRLAGEMPPEPKGADDPRRCVRKQRGAVHFCVEPVDWPPDLMSRLRISTIMYQGAGAIVRYDEGRASRMHVVFPTEAFEAVVTYYRSRFGAPDEVAEREISPFAQPRRMNVAVVWRRQDPATERQATLEIRNFDDARGGFPDLRHGAILLYDEASPPIFPVLSPLDLMPTRRR